MKGTYVLLIELLQPQEIVVGKLGLLAFPQGFYAYVGSAMNGFEFRISYHLREKRRSRWHIDYLLQKALIKEVILWETEERVECILAQVLSKELPSITGFGSSDCRCSSHLYFDTRSSGVIKTHLFEFRALYDLAEKCLVVTKSSDLDGKNSLVERFTIYADRYRLDET